MFEQDWVKSLNFNRQILGLLLLMISITFEFESSGGREMRDRVQLWVGVLGITQAQSVSNSLVSRAQWSEWYHDDDQWSVMGVSWPQFMTPHPAGASEEESEWLGDRWKVVFSVCTGCTECSHHQTWSMAGSLVCSHIELTWHPPQWVGTQCPQLTPDVCSEVLSAPLQTVLHVLQNPLQYWEPLKIVFIYFVTLVTEVYSVSVNKLYWATQWSLFS